MPPARKRPASALDDDDATRSILYKDLVQHGTKTGLMHTLVTLQRAGLITSGVVRGGRAVRRDLAHAQREHCDVRTPYGPVLQTLDLPLPTPRRWSFTHPLALLYHLATLNSAFGELMVNSMQPGKPMTLVLYMDEITPGNPLRPEKSRTMQAIYWAFLEWPQYILQRVAAWMCFGVLRTTVAEQLAGKMSEFMKIVLHSFFPEHGPSLTSGVAIPIGPDRTVIVTGCFGGFLADEKAHKEVACCVGASGIKPCLGCKNIHNRVPLHVIHAHGLQSLSCVDPSLFDPHTDASVFEAADYMAATAAADPASVDELETTLGIKYVPTGILYDAYLRGRGIYRPVTNMIRDWMHVYLNSGIANSHVFELLCVLKSQCGIARQTVQSYMSSFKLPKKRGVVGPNWLGDRRVKTKLRTLASFAGIMLSMVPLICAFLEDVVEPEGMIAAHVQCFRHLTNIVAILALGADRAMDQMGRLAHEILAHARLFVELYPNNVKPKFHMAFHIIPDAMRLLKCLSTFVTERKHRTTKRAALHVFRHLEITVTRDMVNRQCQAVASNAASFFKQTYMVIPCAIVLGGANLVCSRAVNTICGLLKVGDVVFVRRGAVGMIKQFWGQSACDDLIIATIDEYACVTRTTCLTDSPVTSFVAVSDIVDAVPFAKHSANKLRIVLPIAASF